MTDLAKTQTEFAQFQQAGQRGRNEAAQENDEVFTNAEMSAVNMSQADLKALMAGVAKASGEAVVKAMRESRRRSRTGRQGGREKEYRHTEKGLAEQRPCRARAWRSQPTS